MARTVLGKGDAHLVDLTASLEVALLHDGMALAGDERLGWSATANLALVGDELVQFGVAEPVGERSWRLSQLLRGRRGTEWAMATHRAGERFVLVDAETLVPWTLPASAIGATIRVAASGIGDVAPAEATMRFSARALLPPDPVAATAGGDGAGGLVLGWTRRSRLGWSWNDGRDAPLGEQEERYRVMLARDGAAMAIETGATNLRAPAAMLATLGSGAVTATITQLGTFGPSQPGTMLTYALGE